MTDACQVAVLRASWKCRFFLSCPQITRQSYKMRSESNKFSEIKYTTKHIYVYKCTYCYSAPMLPLFVYMSLHVVVPATYIGCS